MISKPKNRAHYIYSLQKTAIELNQAAQAQKLNEKKKC